MGQVVPVNGQTGTREIGRAGEAHASSERKFAERRTPSRGRCDAADAFGQADGADSQIVGGERVGLFGDAEPKIGRIEGQPLGDLVDLNFLAETALWRAVSALGPARRFVG